MKLIDTDLRRMRKLDRKTNKDIDKLIAKLKAIRNRETPTSEQIALGRKNWCKIVAVEKVAEQATIYIREARIYSWKL